MTATASVERSAIWRDFDVCYRAVAARDARFDGQFITAVATTRIYCRPSCPAVTPKPQNVRFYPTAAAAQAAGYRACRRCLPDAVPGSPEWNVRADLAGRAMRLIADGVVEREGVPGLARRLGYSERQLNRALTAELGAGPLALARAHRAHSARLLIELTDLPFGDAAFAAGFSSIRQFNATVREVFGCSPSQLRARRKQTARTSSANGSVDVTLRLPFREPFDAEGIFRFLRVRAIPGVEIAHEDGYARTLRLPHGTATTWLWPPKSAARHVHCLLRLSDMRDLGSAVTRVRRLLDLDADPAAVDSVLATDAALADSVARTPGIRVPGAVDGPELVIRALLGQQISVAAARTTAGRLAEALGERLPHPDEELTTLFPTPEAIAEHGADVLNGPRRRIEAIVNTAAAMASGELDVHVGRAPDELRADLLALPGIGSWTADYVLMRVLAAPDVLLTGDVALRQGAATLGLPTAPADLTRRLDTVRPWRSYAGMHLWRAAPGTTTRKG
ncbi:DNA-3-methyladenine glycosylase 2 [Thermocrispum municipale]|uniref:DNA-3-methyladenine glycosylase 2 n=1 Tax=Thermocrispum municipale TaxID=37926 RepID=UPI0004059130|nr:DNA-3-methyladenine glycosylase 2 [Thermocrispum municipale]